MIGTLERGSVKTVCKVKPAEGGFEGHLSIPGWGTKFTAVYPDKEDAIAALVDLRAEAFPSLSEAIREATAPLECPVRRAVTTGIADHTYAVAC